MSQDLRFDIITRVLGAENAEALRAKFSSLGSAADGLNSKLVKFASATYIADKLREIGTAGVQSVKEIIDFGDGLAALSEQTGVSAQALSGFKGAADQANLSFEELQKGLKKFSAGLGDLGNNDKLRNALRSLGIDAVDSTTKKVRDSGEVIRDLASKFENMADGPKKAALSLEIFGKSGVAMIPFLNQGSEALEKFGLKFSDSFAKNSDAFNDNLAVIKNQIRQNLVDMLDGALPTLLAFQEAVSSLMGRDQKGNSNFGKEIAQGLAEAADYTYKIFHGFATVGGIVKGIAQTLSNIYGAVFGKIILEGEQLLERLKKTISELSEGNFKKAFNAATADKKEFFVFKNFKEQVSNAWSDFDNNLDRRKKNVDAFSKKMQDVISGKAIKEVPAKRGGTDAPGIASDQTKRELDAVEKFRLSQMQSIQTERMKIEGYNLSTVALQKNLAAQQLRADAEKQSIGFHAEAKAKMVEVTEELIKQKLALIDQQEEQRRSFGVGAQMAFKEYLERARDVASQTKEMFSRAFQNMENSLVNFVKTGKLSFKDFADAIIDDLIRIAIRQAAVGIIASFAGGAAVNAGGNGGAGSARAFANGGIMTDAGPVALRKYASGGIATSPQLALFGEGSRPEAFVPLPDGRSIPVSMKGGGASTNISIQINVEQGTETSSGSGEKTGRELANVIKLAVQSELVNQKRPGGILA